MPELPEVETSRRQARVALLGRRIDSVEVAEDSIVFVEATPQAVTAFCQGSYVTDVGRKGKLMWLTLDGTRHLGLHLGMSGRIFARQDHTNRSVAYRHAATPNEKFHKLTVQTADSEVRLDDPRRLARVWLLSDADLGAKLGRLGPDALDDLPSPEELVARWGRKSTPIKAALLDQAVVSGIGNYLADEVLYQSRIAPARECRSLSRDEAERLWTAIQQVCGLAVAVEADARKYPADWLFHVRWGKGREGDTIRGESIVWTDIGGRTTAWVPTVQR